MCVIYQGYKEEENTTHTTRHKQYTNLSNTRQNTLSATEKIQTETSKEGQGIFRWGELRQGFLE